MSSSIIKNTLGQYLIIVLLIFSFVTYPGATQGTEDPVVWFFNGYPIILVFIVSVIFCSLLFVKGFIIDKISFILFLRMICCLVPLVYVQSIASFSSHYPVVILTFIAYGIGRITEWKYEHKISSIIVVFGIIICYQVIQTFNTIPVEYFDLSYKRYIRVPIAASNVIASYLTPIFFLFVFNYYPKKYIKIAISILFISSIILTKSRGGIVVLLLTYITYLVFIKYKFKLKYIIPALSLLSIGIYYISNIPEVQLFLLGFSADNNVIDANSLSSGRLDIFGEEFSRFLQHPLFGNGMIFNSNTSISGSHNLFIELLVQSGLIGTLLYICPIIIVLKRFYRRLHVKDSLGWLLFLIATLYHGMIEVNFFNYSTDILFWSICGLTMGQNQSKSNNEISTSTCSIKQ